MKNILLTIFLLAFYSANTQISGNINYSEQNVNYQEQIQFVEPNIAVPQANKNQISLNIKGMANVKADNYVAIFALTQVGKTMKQTDSLLNKRFDAVIKSISKMDSTELFVDMVSFVPLYDVVFEKKLFSKDSYNEIPDGFEMKKNLHIRYKNHAQLSTIISICAEAEIYNLIRVDYFSKQLDEIKLKLLEEARKKLKTRVTHYQTIMGSDLDKFEKRISDGYKVEDPTERYQKCVAYNNNNFKLKSSARQSKASKNQAQYYQPIVNKEFDFVINPIIVEPVIQVMYELKLTFFEKPLEKKEKDVLLLTPNGDVKPIAFN